MSPPHKASLSLSWAFLAFFLTDCDGRLRWRAEGPARGRFAGAEGFGEVLVVRPVSMWVHEGDGEGFAGGDSSLVTHVYDTNVETISAVFIHQFRISTSYSLILRLSVRKALGFPGVLGPSGPYTWYACASSSRVGGPADIWFPPCGQKVDEVGPRGRVPYNRLNLQGSKSEGVRIPVEVEADRGAGEERLPFITERCGKFEGSFSRAAAADGQKAKVENLEQ